jgi:hypothetical protein
MIAGPGGCVGPVILKGATAPALRPGLWNDGTLSLSFQQDFFSVSVTMLASSSFSVSDFAQSGHSGGSSSPGIALKVTPHFTHTNCFSAIAHLVIVFIDNQ